MKRVSTIDSGLITVLAQMGLVGLGVIGALIAIFLKRGVSIFKRVRNPLLKGVSLGIISFYVQAIVMFAGMTGIAFTHQAGICTLGLAVGLQEVLLRVDGEYRQV